MALKLKVKKTEPVKREGAFPIQWAHHPGEFILLAIEDHETTFEQLSFQIIETSQTPDLVETLKDVIDQKALLTDALIRALARAFGGSETYWQNIQRRYLADRARLNAPVDLPIEKR